MQGNPMEKRKSQTPSIGLLLVGVALGLLLALQWRSAPAARLTDTSYARDRTALTIARLEAEQDALKAQVAELRQQLDERQRQKQSADTLQGLAEELARQKVLAGLVALHGPGVEVVLNDSNRQVVPSAVNPELYLVHDYDLRDVVNLLWAAGTEAMSVNGERIVASTSIYCVGATIMVNDTRLSPPYVIHAIGPAEQQEALLKNPKFLADLRNRVSAYGLTFSVAQVADIEVPAYRGGFGALYASVSVSP
ncbi:MAG: DUF881 domain-containing protein [Anaerolineales bacterium]